MDNAEYQQARQEGSDAYQRAKEKGLTNKPRWEDGKRG